MTVSLTLSFFPVRSLFVIFSFLLTMAPFKFVRFAHGANLRTLALSLRSNAVYATSFAPKGRKQRVIALFSAVWSEIDGITHIVFLSCSFAIRDIFFFAHYGFLQVRQVCARRKLAHPRYVALLHNRAMIPSFAPIKRGLTMQSPFNWSERRDSNPQQPAWEAGILPLNYFRLACRYYITVPFILQ